MCWRGLTTYECEYEHIRTMPASPHTLTLRPCPWIPLSPYNIPYTVHGSFIDSQVIFTFTCIIVIYLNLHIESKTSDNLPGWGINWRHHSTTETVERGFTSPLCIQWFHLVLWIYLCCLFLLSMQSMLLTHHPSNTPTPLEPGVLKFLHSCKIVCFLTRVGWNSFHPMCDLHLSLSPKWCVRYVSTRDCSSNKGNSKY